MGAIPPLAKIWCTPDACSQSYVSFYEQFATLLDLQLWAGNKVAHPELHKALRGQWEHQVQGQPLGGATWETLTRGAATGGPSTSASTIGLRRAKTLPLPGTFSLEVT